MSVYLAAALIRMHEGLRLTVYDDDTGLSVRKGDTVRGCPSIGYGRNLTLDRGITKVEAEFMLANDLAIAQALAEQYVGKLCWSRLDPVRRAVLMDMAHNLGSSRLKGFVRFQQALYSGAYDMAADEMRDSLWCRQVPSRAQRLARIMEVGVIEGEPE